MRLWPALAGGLAGACALTLLHETARRLTLEAPRMDLLGSEALAKIIRKVGRESPGPEALHRAALAGDLASNTLYYSLVGLGSAEQAWSAGLLIGTGAGLGAITLPEPLGLTDAHANRTPATTAMTVAWYTVGGLAAAAVYRRMAKGGR